MFNETDPNKIAEKLNKGLNKVAEKLIIKKKIQNRKDMSELMTQNRESPEQILKNKAKLLTMTTTSKK